MAARLRIPLRWRAVATVARGRLDHESGGREVPISTPCLCSLSNTRPKHTYTALYASHLLSLGIRCERRRFTALGLSWDHGIL